MTDEACGNPIQSPINLHPDQSFYQEFNPRLQFTNYDHILQYTEYDITNNGHTVLVSFSYNNKSVSVSGGGLPGRYALQQFHFHWGSQNDIGSEHSINGGYYPMEMHFVHFNATFNEYNAATDVHDGLTVLGVFIQISEQDNPILEHIVKFLTKIEYENDKTNITEKFSLQDLLPSNTDDFYRYEGSLTTPPCYSSVIWTVFRHPITISQRQLNVFRSLRENVAGSTGKDELLVNNFRPPQPLHGRTVIRTYDLSIEDNWNYEDPTQWYMLYPTCDGFLQSPIALNSSSAKVVDALDDFTFNGYSKSSTVTINNTGHSIEIHVNPDISPMSVSGGGLPSTYILYQINFHFGSSKSTGSEHTIDNTVYPLEIQLLHFNSEYGNKSTASQFHDGLAAFSVLAQMKESQTNVSILDSLTSLQYPGRSVILDSFKARSLLPDNTEGFYRYNGSLTTPECTENVVWTVFTTTLCVPARQLDALRTCLYITPSDSTNKISMADRIVRPIQPTNGRPVLLSKRWPSPCSAASPLTSLKFTYLLVIIVALCKISMGFI